MDDTNSRSDTRSLLEQIGIDPRDFEWQQLAACEGYPTNFFFEDYEKSTTVATQVDLLCLGCPVMRECYELGANTKSTGVFGGLYLNNGEPQAAKNAHKNTETMKRIAKRIYRDE